MSQQIGLFMTESDLDKFVESLRSIGFWSVPRVLPKNAVPDRVNLTEVDPRGSSHLYLVPSELAPVEAMYPDAPSEPDKQVLDLRNSPVLEFALPTQRGTELHEGRIFMQTNSKHPLYKHAAKAFRKIAKPWLRACR